MSKTKRNVPPAKDIKYNIVAFHSLAFIIAIYKMNCEWEVTALCMFEVDGFYHFMDGESHC